MTPMNEVDHAKVSVAIAAAESGTDGEVIAIITERSDSYHDVGLHYAVAVLFLLMAILTAWPGQLEAMWTLAMGWTAPPNLQQLLLLQLGLGLLTFLLALFAMRWMPLRLALTPASTKTRRVRRRAVMLFKAAAERRTVGRTGVMIYLSMGEHRAEIIGDDAITAVTTPESWGDDMLALLTEVKAGRTADGIVAAVKLIAVVLAEHFPKDGDDINEIPDKLIEL